MNCLLGFPVPHTVKAEPLPTDGSRCQSSAARPRSLPTPQLSIKPPQAGNLGQACAGQLHSLLARCTLWMRPGSTWPSSMLKLS